MARDRHIRRDGNDYAIALERNLPQGVAWSRDYWGVLMRTVRGLAQVFGYVDQRAADLLERETDPRLALEMFTDWERNWGLPDPCLGEAQSLDDRRKILMQRMTMIGGQSRQFFIDVAADLGYTITITEWAPFMAGVSRCGDTRQQDIENSGDGSRMRWYIGPPEERFYWTVKVGAVRLTWFRAGSGQAGIDPHLRIGIATDLECILDRWAPAHTDIIYDYSAFPIEVGATLTGAGSLRS